MFLREWRILFLLFLIGFPLSFISEYSVAPFFQVFLLNLSDVPRFVPSLLAGLLDVVFIYAAYFFLSLYFGELWTTNWSVQKVFAVIASGVISVVIAEKIALAFGLWVYASSMPIVPILEVAIFPIALLAIVPLVTLYLAAKIEESLKRA